MKHICQVWSFIHGESSFENDTKVKRNILQLQMKTCKSSWQARVHVALQKTHKVCCGSDALWNCSLRCRCCPPNPPHTYTEQHFTPILIVSFFHVFDDTKCRGRLYFRLYITHHPLTCKATFWHSERHRVGEAAAALYLSGTMQKLGSMLHHGLPRAPLPYPLQPEGSGLSFSYFSILSFSILVCMLWYDNPIAPYFVFHVTF